MKTKPENVLLVGACSSIGVSLALGYAKKGFKVALADSNCERLEELKKRVKRAGAVKTVTIVADMDTEESCRDIVAQTEKDLEQLHLLYYLRQQEMNAQFLELQDYEEASKRIMTVNFRALVWLVHYSYSLLKKYNGRVVVLSSAIGGDLTPPGCTFTCAAADATNAFIRSLQTENGGVDFTIVNAARLEPTYTVMVADGSIETRDSEKSHYGISKAANSILSAVENRKDQLSLVTIEALSPEQIRFQVEAATRRVQSLRQNNSALQQGLPICREFAASGKCLRKNCPFAHIS